VLYIDILRGNGGFFVLNTITQDHLFENGTEAHYRFHTQIDLSQYPQVHDFFEIVLVTSGVLHLKICGQRFALEPGGLLLIRPGDIHEKSGSNCSHINLAFPAHAVDALFEYLCDTQDKERLFELPFLLPVILPAPQLCTLQEKMKFLNTIHTSDWTKARTILRSILFEVIIQYIVPMLFCNSQHANLPEWLINSIAAWQSAEHRQEGLDFFCSRTGYTKEHLCRAFRRYLGMPSSAYLNQQRLDYAVNLMLHSDYSMIDIIYEAGFKSASRFYRIFRETYGMSPKQFCTQHIQWG